MWTTKSPAFRSRKSERNAAVFDFFFSAFCLLPSAFWPRCAPLQRLRPGLVKQIRFDMRQESRARHFKAAAEPADSHNRLRCATASVVAGRSRSTNESCASISYSARISATRSATPRLGITKSVVVFTLASANQIRGEVGEPAVILPSRLRFPFNFRRLAPANRKKKQRRAHAAGATELDLGRFRIQSHRLIELSGRAAQHAQFDSLLSESNFARNSSADR